MQTSQTFNLYVSNTRYNNLSLYNVLTTLSHHFAVSGDSLQFELTCNTTGQLIDLTTPCFVVNNKVTTLNTLLELVPYYNRLSSVVYTP